MYKYPTGALRLMRKKGEQKRAPALRERRLINQLSKDRGALLLMNIPTLVRGINEV